MSRLFNQCEFPSNTAPPAAGVCGSELPSVLRRWQEPGCQLALWTRSLAPPFVQQLDRIRIQDLPSVRFTTACDEVGRRFGAALAQSPLGETPLSTALAHDISHLVSLFARATGSQDADVRLECVRDDACRKFHTDSTLARLVTTYVGPGTVWVPAEHADEALRLQEDYAGPWHEMPRFAVGMFGGAHARSGGLLHRSPRIARTGSYRLFFCVNRPFGSSADL